MTDTQRVAIVTGAAGGIGRAMTRGLLAAAARVAGVDRNREPLEALAASAREQGKADDLLTIQTDLTSDAATEEITKATRDRFGRIDILVNNAGIGPGSDRLRQTCGDISGRDSQQILLTFSALPNMRCTQHGRVRMVNETTSLGTMLNACSPTHSRSNVQKAAATTKPYDRRGYDPEKMARFFATY
jgi:NAD(P)-dependent dehydrogenase (short-subunit alcohol dehydrogenase family)